MEAPIKQVRISKTAKEQLIKLKRITKIENWNILCRWAFCRSLAEPTIPAPVTIKTSDGVEMTWEVFWWRYSRYLINCAQTKVLSKWIRYRKHHY